MAADIVAIGANNSEMCKHKLGWVTFASRRVRPEKFGCFGAASICAL